MRKETMSDETLTGICKKIDNRFPAFGAGHEANECNDKTPNGLKLQDRYTVYSNLSHLQHYKPNQLLYKRQMLHIIISV